jgi:hypothetical protein
MPLPQTFNTSSVSVWFEAECVSLLSLLVMIGSDLDMDPRIGLRPLVVLNVEHDTQTAFQVC